jgi:hypothetical protein
LETCHAIRVERLGGVAAASFKRDEKPSLVRRMGLKSSRIYNVFLVGTLVAAFHS